ncbi:MAG: type II toxin-antitoxin system RelB/DinJ family antitoxin [Treponemataceae bacterium]|nr:MAG: type II toxin-antitoxin system RelB/DinJ family antitoxin [Treponemataceae bacterium]
MNNATIQIRTDAEVKEKADSIFKQLGITLSDGINIFLRQVNLNRGLPFEVRIDRQIPADAVKTVTAANKSIEEQLDHVEKLCGAFKDCSFSTERYFAQKQHDKD